MIEYADAKEVADRADTKARRWIGLDCAGLAKDWMHAGVYSFCRPKIGLN